jgi:hypothetical protein
MENQVVYLDQNVNPTEFGYVKAATKVRELFESVSKHSDITNIDIVEYKPEECTVKFRVVHYSVRSADSVPFQTVTFKEA